MTTTRTHRITTLLAGSAITAAFLAGGAALGATPAQAQPTGAACLTARSATVSAAPKANPLTRAGQLTGQQSRTVSPPASCIGH